MGIISNPFILLTAYRNIRSRAGAMIPASPLPQHEFKDLSPEQQEFAEKNFILPDELCWKKLFTISNLLKKGCYPWFASRQIWIPKPGRKDSLRPINITAFADKMVQESIRMVLEAIYEPVMHKMNCSFGFRASNGCREAITSIAENSSGFITAIEDRISLPQHGL
uniref:Group II intron-encoded protein LtrA n=1 Tax=Haematococcus lacustris TaxID=44745 RepID=A0A2K9YRX3_HAELA|nr:group II intron-encoded protein LtrA [Haematococcus lacustris]YP_009463740.1 group II intron-encoded protein LtrA [Haematococcus lacustris]AUW36495.1 group II intron-encoded protein LtrA [Haematococcus lacustris]AUW36562.1 group II intron-encoded protein LtrA [Haematococcus lacustris]